MAKNDIDVSINEVYESIEDTIAKEMTKKIINLFIENGLTYKIKIGYGNVYRIFCYIKKSKEALIINTIGKNFGPFELQLRIKNKSTLEKLESFSTNVRDMILSGKDCFGQRCCNCGSAPRPPKRSGHNNLNQIRYCEQGEPYETKKILYPGKGSSSPAKFKWRITRKNQHGNRSSCRFDLKMA